MKCPKCQTELDNQIWQGPERRETDVRGTMHTPGRCRDFVVAQRDEERAHRAKLGEMVVELTACSDRCELGALLNWFAPGELESIRGARSSRFEAAEATIWDLTRQRDEAQSLRDTAVTAFATEEQCAQDAEAQVAELQTKVKTMRSVLIESRACFQSMSVSGEYPERVRVSAIANIDNALRSTLTNEV